MQKDNGPPNIEQYKQYWSKKIKANKEKLEERKRKLTHYAKLCSNFLKENFQVKKVYLIGSLARDYKIHENSDIDLVVEGLEDKQYFQALNKLYEIVPNGINIDLITKETATHYLKEIIKTQGVAI